MRSGCLRGRRRARHRVRTAKDGRHRERALTDCRGTFEIGDAFQIGPSARAFLKHWPELAEEYSTRIIKLKDGLVIDDSNPYHAGAEAPAPAGEKRVRQAKGQKTSMSFLLYFV